MTPNSNPLPAENIFFLILTSFNERVRGWLVITSLPLSKKFTLINKNTHPFQTASVPLGNSHNLTIQPFCPIS